MCPHDRLCTAITIITKDCGSAFGLHCHDSLECRCLQRWLFVNPVCSRFWTCCLRDFPTLQPMNDARPKHVAPHIPWVYGSVSLLSILILLFLMVVQWIGQALESTGHFGHETQVPCFHEWQDMPRPFALEPASMTLPEMSCSRSSSLALPWGTTRKHSVVMRCSFVATTAFLALSTPFMAMAPTPLATSPTWYGRAENIGQEWQDWHRGTAK